MKVGSERYKTLLDEALELHLNKNQGYSANNPDAFANFRLAEGMGLTPVQGVLVRLGDKFARVQSLAANPTNDRVSESMRDTLMDLSAYALIAICLMEEDDEPTTTIHRVGELLIRPDERYSDPDDSNEGLQSEAMIDEGGSTSSITCYNRDEAGKCLGHPTKGGPSYHTVVQQVEENPYIQSCCEKNCSLCANDGGDSHSQECRMPCLGCSQ